MATCGPVNRLQAFVLLTLGAITLAVFAGVCGHEFVHFDDAANIYGNPHVAGIEPGQLHWMFTDTAYARRYMPLGWLCYALNREFFGLNPHAFHAVNLTLHLVNTTLLFFLVKRIVLLADGNPAPERNRTAAVWCAGFAALFWAVNPLRVEVVAWASSQIYGVVLLFTMIFLLAWLRAQDVATPPRQRCIFRWVSVAAFAASLLTYPLALFAPVALFALEIFPLRRAHWSPRNWLSPAARALWLDKMPYLLVAVVVVVIAFAARTIPDPRFRPATLDELGLFPRAMQAFYIWAYYVWKPWVPLGLSPSYTTLHAFNPLDAVFLLSAVVVVGVSISLFLSRHRRPGWLALWTCHLALLVPVLGVSEYPHSAYDRYSHLHGVLWSVTLAFGIRALWEQRRRGVLAGMVAASASVLFALVSWQLVPVWRNTVSLYEHIVASCGEHPSRARFDEVLGIHYLGAGLTNEALASFRAASHYESRRADRHILDEGVLHRAHTRTGDALAALGRLDEAATEYRLALQAKPGVLPVVARLGAALRALGRDEELAEVLADALRLYPGDLAMRRDLESCFERLGRKRSPQDGSAVPAKSALKRK